MECSSGETGLVPANYIDELDAAAHQEAAKTLAASSSSTALASSLATVSSDMAAADAEETIADAPTPAPAVDFSHVPVVEAPATIVLDPSLVEWLKSFRLEKLGEALHTQGVTSLEDVVFFEDADIDSLVLNKPMTVVSMR